MPESAILSVRGMGVAESVRTSTFLLISLSVSLWPTPKRCSSSTTSSPRSLNFIFLLNSLCVPITKSTEPASSFLSNAVCSEPVL